MIEVKDLVKRYGRRLAVDHLSFTLEPGRIYGFLGPNGAGKSTTMNIMTGYLGATSGEVLVNGHSIAKEAEAAKRCLGYLPEQPPLYLEMTVEEYLTFALELKKVPRGERGEQLEKILALTGLTEVRGRLIRNLSKGYRQRVGLGQALAGFPEILILDEPMVGLDPKQIIEIRDLMRLLAREHTVVFSSHILSEVQEVCDHIFIIHQGKLRASGSVEELERTLGGEDRLELTLRGEWEAVRQALEAVAGVKKLERRDCSEEGAVALSLWGAGDLREAVFYACAQEKLPILAMGYDRMTLEDVFLQLTGEESHSRGGEPEESPEWSEEDLDLLLEEEDPARDGAEAEEEEET